MREILFRGKRISNGKWVEGFYFMQHNPAGEEEQYIRVHETDFNVLQETVGQFTGLTDKNGVRIFEGDIVKYDEELYPVVYEPAAGMFELRGDGFISDFGYIDSSIFGEVIGNIHDNPELLEVSE